MNFIDNELKNSTLTIISPHQDDAALSLSNFIMGHDLGNIRIINFFTISEYCPYANVSERRDIMALRHKEDREFISYKHNSTVDIIDLAEYDSLIRLGISNMDDIFTTQTLSNADVSCLHSLHRNMAPHIKGRVFVPLAIGGHIDHILAFLASISHFRCYNFVAFYLDVPYWLRTSIDVIKKHIHCIESLIGTILTPHASMVSPTWDKLKVSDIYKSQITRHEILEIVNSPFQGEVFFLPEAINCEDLFLEAIEWTDLNH